MTIINFKVDEDKKKEIEEITKIKGYKSVSEFIREAIDEKLNLQKIVDDFLERNPPLDKEKIDIPDFIPDGKYLGIARNEIVITGDSLEEVMQKLIEKFPESATAIMRKGKEMEHFETLFSFFSKENTKCYHQKEIDNRYYAILELGLEINNSVKPIIGLIDSGASITALDKRFIEDIKLKPIRKSQLLTANGIIEVPIFKSIFYYEKQSFELEFTTSDISGLKIHALIGKNFIDLFNLMFLGKQKLFCLQTLN